MSDYQIEKDIPLPPGAKLIPFDKMEKGDSVKIELKEEKDIGTIRQRVYRANKEGDKRFSCVKTNDRLVYRIFRME